MSIPKAIGLPEQREDLIVQADKDRRYWWPPSLIITGYNWSQELRKTAALWDSWFIPAGVIETLSISCWSPMWSDWGHIWLQIAFVKFKKKLCCNYVEMTGPGDISRLCSICQNWKVLASGIDKLLGRPDVRTFPVLMPLPHGHEHLCVPWLQQACFFPME